RETARLLWEHGGELGIEDGDGEDDRRRDPPDQHCSPATHVEHRPAERSQQEAWIRETDHEPVVPAERLQELAFLDDCLSHALPPSLVDLAACRARGRRSESNTCRRSFQSGWNHTPASTSVLEWAPMKGPPIT